MPTFAEIFEVPAGHVLKQIRFRSTRGDQHNGWEHEEYDGTGNLIARYESWADTDFSGATVSEGWKKFDPTGVLLGSGTSLPI